MKITDIIRSVLDIIDGAEAADKPAVAVAVQVEPEEQIADMQKLAGILGVEEPGYANEPNEIIAPITAAFPAGDDVHHSKNPADMRSDSISLYPDWQARK